MRSLPMSTATQHVPLVAVLGLVPPDRPSRYAVTGSVVTGDLILDPVIKCTIYMHNQ